MRSILKDIIPCWYELSWRGGERPEIILRIHKDFIAAVGQIPSDAPMVNVFKKDFNFSLFEGRLEGDFWGFNKAMRNIGGSEKDFVDWAVSVPKIKKETGRNCDYCSGSG